MDRRLVEIFPPLGLRITCGPLELRGITDVEVLALLEVVREGVHDADTMPFAYPWTDAPAGELPLDYLKWWWRQMATWSREAWEINLCALWDGEVVGVQGVSTQDFPTLRYGETGSWVGRKFHGRGIGTAMRQAMCAFLFDELGFEFITSAAFADNAASLRVSEKLGYRENGLVWQAPRGGRVVSQRLLLAPEDFVRGPAITVEGAEAVRRLIAADEPEPGP